MPDGVAILQGSFELGIRRDFTKDRIGANAVWDLSDYVPELLGAPLRKRGAWEYKGSMTSPGGYVNALASVSMNGGRYNLAALSDGTVQRVTAGGSTWAVDGTTRNVGLLKQNPVFYFDDLFFPSYNGTQTMSRATETDVTAYTYTATYKPTYLTAWKNRLVGAVGERIIFGPPGDPNQTWDDDSVYIQTQQIKGLKALSTITLVFYEGHTERMRGSIPAGYPSVTNDDISFDVLFPEIGCLDAFSICDYLDMVIWADRNGVYMTEGAAPIDLTAKGGIKSLWRETLQPYTSDFDAGNIRVASGVYGEVLHVSITNTSTKTAIATFVCHLPSYRWWRYENCPFTCYAHADQSPTGGAKELFGGLVVPNGRVAELSHILEEPGNRTSDENGIVIQPTVTFPYHRFAAGAVTIADIYLGYALESANSQPILNVEATTDPQPVPTFTSFGDGDEYLAAEDLHGDADAGYHYRRIPVRQQGAGIGVKVSQVGESTDTRIYNLSASIIPQPGWSQL